MRRGRILIILAVILIVGLIVAIVAMPRILSVLQPATPTAIVYQVYFSSQNIAEGTTITEDLLKVYSLPQISDAMFTVEEKDQLIGKVARFPIDQEVPITTGMVTLPDETAGVGPQWASTIPEGMNAIAVPITRLASASFGTADGSYVNIVACMLMVDVDPSYQTILPNHVGVVTAPAANATMTGITLGVNNGADPAYQGRTEVEQAFQQGIYVIPSEGQRPRPVCQMILQDVRVLKLGTFSLNPAPSNQPTPTPQPGQAPAAVPAPDIVTLIVSPQDAVTLTYMVYNDIPLYLSLRRTSDRSRLSTEAATLQFLLSQYNIPVPVKLGYTFTPRVDKLALPFLPNDVVTVQPQQ